MGGAPDGFLPPIPNPVNLTGMKNAPHYGQPYSFTRKMVGRFYQDNSLKSNSNRKEQPPAAELRKKAANAQRLQMLKMQYSERRKLVENDLMREAMHIQQMEAKLMQIQQHRQGVRRRSNSEVLVINHPSYGQPMEGGMPVAFMASYGSQRSYSPRSVFSNHPQDGGEDEPESDDDYGHESDADPVVRHPHVHQPPGAAVPHDQQPALSPNKMDHGERQPQARRRPRARSMPTMAPPSPPPLGSGTSSNTSACTTQQEEAAAAPEQQQQQVAAAEETPTKQEVGSLPCETAPEPPAAASSSAASSVVEPPRVLDPNRVELRQLSVEEIGKMLKNHSLGLYEDIFSTNCVDGETLTDPTLTEADLLELGIKIRLHRKRLLDLIQRFKTEGVPLSDLSTPVVPLELPSPVRVSTAARLQRQASRDGLGSRRASSRQGGSLLCHQYTVMHSPAPGSSATMSGMPSPAKTIVIQSRSGTADSCASNSRAMVRSRQSSFRPLFAQRTDMRSSTDTEEGDDRTALPPQQPQQQQPGPEAGVDINAALLASQDPQAPCDGVAPRIPMRRPMTRDDDESSAGFASDFDDQYDRESVADIF